MPRTTVFVVSDEMEVIENAKTHFSPLGVTVNSFSTQQWRNGMDNAMFRNQLLTGVPALAGGSMTVEPRGNVLPFPGGNNSTSSVVNNDSRVSTMNELESKAIENAISQFRGNLTEAAKALGIGRATLYRKVKQYQIDPAMARKKRAA